MLAGSSEKTTWKVCPPSIDRSSPEALSVDPPKLGDPTMYIESFETRRMSRVPVMSILASGYLLLSAFCTASSAGLGAARATAAKNAVSKNVEKIRKVTHVPVAVGFGIATPEDAVNVAAIADGVIVGSAIVKQIAAHREKPEMVKHVAEFVRSLKIAMRAAQPKTC